MLPPHLEDALRATDLDIRPVARSLLLVDDEEENLEVLSALLDNDWQVYTARSGREALDLLNAGLHVDLVVADQRMHGMTGVELLSRLARERPEIVRIVLTAYGDVGPMLDALNEAAAWRFLVKPYEPEEVRSTIAEALRIRERDALLRQVVRALTLRRDRLSETLEQLESTQEQLLAVERLSTVGNAASGIVHNLRNLSTIMSLLMAEIDRRGAPPSVQEAVTAASGSMNSLVDLLENIRQLARSHDRELKPEPVDLARFLSTTAALGMMQGSGHVIRVELDERTRTAVVDPDRMRQGLLALLDNAIRASKPEDPIVIVVRPLPSDPASTSAPADGEWICFEVHDQGRGMSPDELTRATEPFFSGFTPSSLGLGLEVARLTAESHAGFVELQSQAGQGTIARLLFPPDVRYGKSGFH